MKIGVIINTNAGGVDAKAIVKKIEDSLFRCELNFLISKDILDLDIFISKQVVENESDYLILCGGDGTLNYCIQPLIRLRKNGFKIPPICLVRSGTANDLASDLGVSERIDRAVRTILDGEIKTVDLIEISDENRKTSYMISNGGLGVPAETAKKANIFREFLRKGIEHKQNRVSEFLFEVTNNLVKQSGSSVYAAFLGETLLNWKNEDWEIEITSQGKTQKSRAPIVLINNQPVTGKLFKTAPLTSNSDGFFNVLVISSHSLLNQTKALYDITRGQLLDNLGSENYETAEIKIKSCGKKKMKYFGDGEILFEDASELTIRCIHPGLPIVVSK